VYPSEGQLGTRGVSDTIESSSSETVTEEGGVAGPETGTVQPVSSGDNMVGSFSSDQKDKQFFDSMQIK
jgi:hypothetical protein